MIKFKTYSGENVLLLGFGLSEDNIQRLKSGQPVVIKLEDMGLREGRIMIFYGKTEADMIKEIKPYLGSDTLVIGVPPDENDPAPADR